MGYYREEIDGIVVRLEPIRNPVSRAVLSALGVVLAYVISDESPLTGEPPLRLVITDEATSEVLFRHGRYRGTEGVEAVKEAVRVIGTLGVDAYIRRETG